MRKYLSNLLIFVVLLLVLAGCGEAQKNDLSNSEVQPNGNDIKADIENKGDYLEVTVTQSNYKDIVGTTQNFSPADESQ